MSKTDQHDDHDRPPTPANQDLSSGTAPLPVPPPLSSGTARSTRTIADLFDEATTRPVAVRQDRWPTGQGKSHKRSYPFEDPQVAEKLLDLLGKGYPARTCVAAVGWPWKTWTQWQRKADWGEEPFASFFHRARVASAEGQCGLLDSIRSAGEGAPDKDGIWKNQWQASRYLLERVDPETYAAQPETRVAIDAVVHPGEPKPDLSRLTVDELEDLFRLAAKVEPVLVAGPVLEISAGDDAVSDAVEE